VVYAHNGVPYNYQEEWNYVSYGKIDGTGDHVNPDWERQISYILFHMQNLDKKEWNEF
jgi:hypothetical protein